MFPSASKLVCAAFQGADAPNRLKGDRRTSEVKHLGYMRGELMVLLISKSHTTVDADCKNETCNYEDMGQKVF
eukprot:CAMPEP_0114503836 /NCGR_PEP_ID=MMETSP0109-20121206/9867_1 /TAXON_ID=29199 /ORGANISM="Chlorarachnion reptans, Strain CCCM449" /LENGTH=72 /DNA_ID=CAMNT_0001681905 /DNA_START=410 /DNA_END=628 /DNA_ORIENTATION=+